ncbi:hypothetical protein D3C80_311290 [compost metagenome]
MRAETAVPVGERSILPGWMATTDFAHDDPAHLGFWVLWRHEKVDVAKDAAARFVENEIPQGLVFCDKARLFPDRIARRRRHAADDDITDFAFCVTGDDVDDFG